MPELISQQRALTCALCGVFFACGPLDSPSASGAGESRDVVEGGSTSGGQAAWGGAAASGASGAASPTGGAAAGNGAQAQSGQSVGGAAAGAPAASGADAGGSAGSGGAAGASAFDPCPPAGSPCRVMPLGDSITEGYRSSDGGGYRKPLFSLSLKDGKSLTFVGSAPPRGPETVDGVPFPRETRG